MKDSVPEVRGFTSARVISDIFQRYASLQLSTVSHETRLRKAGLPDGSPKLVGRMVAEVVEEMATVAADDPRRIDAAEYRRLDTAKSELDDLGTFLAVGAVPSALDHNDLFPGNVLMPDASGGYMFFDFAESLWAHRFSSLTMPMRKLVHWLKLDDPGHGPIDLRDDRARALLDAYLLQWSDYGSIAQLRELAAAAIRMAPVYRTMIWREVLRKAPSASDTHGSTPRAWIFDITREVLL